jgi:hypothetical protein
MAAAAACDFRSFVQHEETYTNQNGMFWIFLKYLGPRVPHRDHATDDCKLF